MDYDFTTKSSMQACPAPHRMKTGCSGIFAGIRGHLDFLGWWAVTAKVEHDRRSDMNIPGFTAEVSLYPTSSHYYGGGTLVQSGATIQPAQIHFPGPILHDPCLLGPNINVGWQSFHDGRHGVVIVTGTNFAARSDVQVRFDNCSSAFPEKGFTTTNACGAFTIWHPCTCDGPPITVGAVDRSGNIANGTAHQIC
jgi:hypothetical protein